MFQRSGTYSRINFIAVVTLSSYNVREHMVRIFNFKSKMFIVSLVKLEGFFFQVLENEMKVIERNNTAGHIKSSIRLWISGEKTALSHVTCMLTKNACQEFHSLT